jgi:hypothetical protein
MPLQVESSLRVGDDLGPVCVLTYLRRAADPVTA